MRDWTLRVVAAATLLGAPCVFAQAPGSPEILVNQVTAGDQVSPSIAFEADGGYVVAWRSGAATIAARRFDTGGAPRGPELTVNVVPAGPNARPAVATFPGGGFLVVWQAPDASGQGIVARRFDAAGAPTTGAMTVNLATAGDQVDPRVSGGPYGYAVVWGSGGSVVGRLLSGAGIPLGVEIPVGAGVLPAVAWRGNGLVFAWADSSGSGGRVWLRLFNGDGAPLGAASVVNPVNPPMPCSPICFPSYSSGGIGVAAAANRSFAVTWDLSGSGATGGLVPTDIYWVQFGSYMRRYDSAGIPLGPEARLNAYTDGSQYSPSVSVAPGGGSLVAWTSVPGGDGCLFCPPQPSIPQDGSASGVYGRLFDAAGSDIGGGEFRVNVTTAGDQSGPAVAAADSSLVVVYQMSDGAGSGLFARRLSSRMTPARFDVDPTDEPSSDGNGVLESGETAVVAPAWRNPDTDQALLSTATAFGGPIGASYSILDGAADFGVIPAGATRSCLATGNCFVLSVSGTRPVEHWDAQLTESATPPSSFAPRTRAVHIGNSFADVAHGSPFYRFVENVFHNGVMLPCGAGAFCPSLPVTREWMAFYVLRSQNPGFLPPPCVAGVERFTDVPASSVFCPWIEELARRGVVGGCGGSRYCPVVGVSREQLAVYLLLTREGTGYAPPACTAPFFNDVPASSPFCRWIEELARRGIVGGCGGGAYCPAALVSREQMSVFLTGTFGLLLYAP